MKELHVKKLVKAPFVSPFNCVVSGEGLDLLNNHRGYHLVVGVKQLYYPSVI